MTKHNLDLLLFACEACARDQCADCVHLTVGAWCPHACAYLWHSPKEHRMTQPVNDDDYAEDAENLPDEDLPDPTDPSQVPPDEGDAGAGK